MTHTPTLCEVSFANFGGRICMPLPPCGDVRLIDLRNLQATTSRYLSLMWLSLRYGHTW